VTLPRLATWTALAAAAVAAAVVCALAPDLPAVRLPAALALALWLPGRALVEALGLAGPDRVRTAAVAAGASLAVALIVSVELAAFGVLASGTWATTTAGVCLALSLVAARGGPVLASPWVADGARLRPRHLPALALALIAVAAIAVAAVLARTPLAVPDDRGYTVFAVVPTASAAGTLTVRATSEEAGERRFIMRVAFGESVTEERPLTLRPGETSDQRITVPADAAAPLVVSLVDPSAIPPHVYRSVRIARPARLAGATP